MNNPATRAEAIDVGEGDQTLTHPSRAIYVGGSGDLVVTMVSGDTATFPNIPAGTLLPIRVTSVTQSGTTVTDAVAIC
jgi:hypothetical protein